MTRQKAIQLLRVKLDEYGLHNWKIRLNQSADSRYLALCSHNDECIIVNAHHIDIHPDSELEDTFLHEIAHAKVGPGHGHDDVWKEMAIKLGVKNPKACSSLTLPLEAIDAIRSGAEVVVEFEEEVIKTAKYKITRLQDKCPFCGKVAKTLRETTIEDSDPIKPDIKIIVLECGDIITKKIPKGTPFQLFIKEGDDPNCKHEWDKNSCIKCNAKKPYDFQIDGMRFLEAGLAVNKGAACFDEMGLGKTIQALGVIKYHPEKWPVLFVVKSGTKYQWSKEIINWCGLEFTPQIINSSKDWLIPGLRCYIIGYDMMVYKQRVNKKTKKVIEQGFDIEKFEKIGIKLVVLDECQQIKNPDSDRTQQVRRVVKNTQVLPLSGTPWKNRGSELGPVMNMLDPIKFYSLEDFKRRWVDTFWEGNKLREGGIRNPERFREFTKDICIRRERQEVMKELPLVNRTKLYVEMNDIEQNTYDEEVSEFVKWYNSYVMEGREDELNGMNILAKLARLRHIIGLAKIPQTIEFVDEFLEDTDRKLVIFVHHQDVGEIIYTQLNEKYGQEMPILKLVSSYGPQERFEIQEKFNNAPRALMVASTLAAGEGLNLQTCADCIMHERQWNPANEEQAEGRFIRIGQIHDSVSAIYAEAEGSVDYHLDGINERKRRAFHESMNKGVAPTWNQTEFAKELATAIVAAHNKKVREKANAAKVLQFNLNKEKVG